MFTLPIAAVAALVYGLYAVFRREPRQRSRFLKREGVTFGLVLATFWWLFALGESFTDSPGSEAWAGLAAEVVSVAVASWFALRHSRGFRNWAIGIVATLAAATVVTRVLGSTWREFVNEHGPVLVIACLVASIPLALWGLHQPGLAGALLLVLGMVGMLSGPSGSGEALMSPLLVSGTMLWLAGRSPGQAAGLAEPTPTDPAIKS